MRNGWRLLLAAALLLVLLAPAASLADPTLELGSGGTYYVPGVTRNYCYGRIGNNPTGATLQVFGSYDSGSGVTSPTILNFTANPTSDPAIAGLNVDLTLGYAAGSPGTVKLVLEPAIDGDQYTASTITVSHSEIIGYQAAGQFSQAGGTHTVGAASGNLYLGYNAGVSGRYSLNNWGDGQPNNGVLHVTGTEYVGYSGSGTFIHGGAVTVDGDLILGQNSGGSGFYQMQDNLLSSTTPPTTLTVHGSEYVGSSGVGTFNQRTGTHTVDGALFLGYDTNATGTYNLFDGSLSAHYESVGDGPGHGIFNQSGGTNTMPGTLFVGHLDNGVGTYNLMGGSLSAGTEEVGAGGGQGLFSQTGGTNQVGTLTLATNNGTGTYNLSGGSLTATQETIGDAGTGVFTQSGGVNTVTGTLTLVANSGTGTYNLQAGSLTAGTVNLNANGLFN